MNAIPDHKTQDTPAEQPYSERTRAIIIEIQKLGAQLDKLQDVGTDIIKIKDTLRMGETRWQGIIRGLKHILSLIDIKL